MKIFFKKSFIMIALFFCNLNYCASSSSGATMPAGGSASAGKLPSVADVFGGLSEQEIAEQVQMGQKFLEDLQAHGSPQEIAEFQRLLEETLNSMSEDDFKDIQAIAQMVEPHLTVTQPQQPAPTTSPSSSSDQTTVTVSSELEEFKKLINTIIQRIDDIFQKINSSKECAEQADAKWKNKSTFANMKRQIYQLKNDRLAQKLSKKDLKDEDKKLVEYLKTYLKDLTVQNDALVIEDDFGLPTSFAEEKKHLKQTKAFLDSCDEAIDTLMPLLEKFLQKWDPEALELAKESESRNKKAAKEATDATARKASAPAQPKSAGSASRYAYNPENSGYGGSGYDGYYPDYDNYGGYNPYGQSGSEFGSPEGSGSGANSGDKTPKAKTNEISATAPGAKEVKDKSNLYDYAMSDLESHIKDDFDSQHEANFINFIKNDIAKNYPDYTLVVANGALTSTLPATVPTAASVNINTTNTSVSQENNWIDGTIPFPLALKSGVVVQGFKNYTNDIKKKLEDEFYPEFRQLHPYIDNLRSDIANMTSDDLKKIQSSKELKAVEDRLKQYQKTFESILPDLDAAFQKNTVPGTANAPSQQPGLLDATTVPRYQNAHENFVEELKTNIGKEIDSMIDTISTIKRSAKRNATKKAKNLAVAG